MLAYTPIDQGIVVVLIMPDAHQKEYRLLKLAERGPPRIVMRCLADFQIVKDLRECRKVYNPFDAIDIA